MSGMRTFLSIAFLLVITEVNAQSFMPGSFIGNSYRSNSFNYYNLKDSNPIKKWSISKYSGISTTLTGWKGGSASIVSAAFGLQLNRRINNNVFAFAGISAAPAFVNFRQNFMSADFNKLNTGSIFYKSNNLNLYSRAEVGLSYVNDERTFQISGSIGVERNSYSLPFYIPVSNKINSYTPTFK
jgi:hypothetical protein